MARRELGEKFRSQQQPNIRTTVNRPSQLVELEQISAAIEKHRLEKASITARRQALERKYTPGILAKNPDAIRELSIAKVDEQLTESAIAGAERLKRELAAKVVPYGYTLYRRLRETIAANKTFVRGALAKRMAPFYDPTWLEFAIAYSRPFTAENIFDLHAPSCALGDPAADTLHPDMTPERVVEEIVALERALAAAEARSGALKKELN